MFKKINNIYRSIILDKKEQEFIEKFKSTIRVHKSNNKKVILLSLYPDYFSLVNFFLLLKEDRFKNCEIVGLWTNQIFIKKNFFRYFIDISLNYFRLKKWQKLYSVCGVNKIYNTNVNLIPFIFLIFLINIFCLKKLVTKKNF